MSDKKHLKNIVAQIKKKADPFTGSFTPDPETPPANKPDTKAPATNTGGGGGGAAHAPSGRSYSGGGSSIIKMQQALQNLAKDVASQINLQDVASGDPTKEQEAKNRDAFGVFLTKNYMRNSKVQGIEYDPDPKVTDVSQKRPDDPTRMSVVMDTMNRIGNEKKGEQFTDG